VCEVITKLITRFKPYIVIIHTRPRHIKARAANSGMCDITLDVL